MKRYISVILFLLNVFTTRAQTPELDSLWTIYQDEYKTQTSLKSSYDTLYFNKKWQACKKNEANYYRIVYPFASYYIVHDHYLNGRLQMEALCSSYEPLVIHGHCIYYHTNGEINKKGQYIFNEPKGIWYYYTAKGKFTETYNFSAPDIKRYDNKSWGYQNQSSLFIGNISYKAKLNKGILSSGHGFGFEAGINPGYFISQKLLLGAFVGWGTRDQLYQTKFEQGYLNDFNANFNGTTLSGNDSIAINYMASIMNKRGYYHERTGYYGIIFRLPYRYMPIVKIYRGTSSYAYKTAGEPVQPQPYVSSEKRDDNDYFDITRNMNWGLEVFLYNGRTRVRDYSELPFARKKALRWCTNLLAFSVYVEKFDTYHSHYTFSDGYHNVDVAMSSFMNGSFMNTHKKEYHVGVRLSVGAF